MFNKPKTKVTMLSVAALQVDDRYQREINEKRVRKLAKEFDWTLFGILEVSKRNGHGQHIVFDGQHRLTAARELDIDQVPCLIHEGLTPEEEADLFAQLQMKRKNLTQIERFRAQVFAGNPESVAIQSILDSVDVKLDSRRHSGDTVSAIMTLENIFRSRGGGHLKRVLSESLLIWQGKNGSMQGSFIDGFSRFLYGYGDKRYTVDVRERLERANPMTILHSSSAIRGGGSQIGVLVSREIRKVSGVRGRPRS